MAVLHFCAHADAAALCTQQEHIYARLAMPFYKLQKRHGSGDNSTATRCLCDAVIMQDAHSSCLAANLTSCHFTQMCYEEAVEHLFAGVMCPSIALYVVCICFQADSEDLDARHGPNVEVPDSSFSPER